MTLMDMKPDNGGMWEAIPKGHCVEHNGLIWCNAFRLLHTMRAPWFNVTSDA